MKTFGDSWLYTPGPTNVPQRILNACARPILHHRTPEFFAELRATLDKAQWLFGTKQAVLPVHTTGRGAMEGALTALLSPGDELICVTNGRYGAMFAQIGHVYGLTVHEVCTDWERLPDMAEIEAAAKAYPKSKIITVCHNDSASGIMLDIARVSRIAHAHGMLAVVDAVSSIGCIQLDFDAVEADVVVTAAQKGLMCPTGMALAVLSDAAWKMAETATLPKYFVNFSDIRKHADKACPETPGSTPVTGVYALHEALTMLQEEGRDAVFARHARLAKAVRATLRALGFAVFPDGIPEESRSHSVTVFTPPSGLTCSDFRNTLYERYGLKIAGGMGKFKDNTLRIGHMGYFFDRDALTLAACLEGALMETGYAPAPGAGVAACLQSLNARYREAAGEKKP